MTFLDKIYKLTSERINSLSSKELEQQIDSSRIPHDFCDIFNNLIAIIAEIKFKSPSLGIISCNVNPLGIASDYLANGASALSILTEPAYFNGSLDYLQNVRLKNREARLLMKDFIIDKRQLLQARIYGADAVLLIVSLLPKDILRDLYNFAIALKLTPLVEVHDVFELEIAQELGANLIGINNRNLKTLEIDLNTAKDVISKRDTKAFFIAESGIHNRIEIEELSSLGFNGFLIGTSLMQQENPGDKLKDLLTPLVDG